MVEVRRQDLVGLVVQLNRRLNRRRLGGCLVQHQLREVCLDRMEISKIQLQPVQNA